MAHHGRVILWLSRHLSSRSERGASVVEYALLVVMCAGIALLARGALLSVSGPVMDKSVCNPSAGYHCN